MKSLRLPKKMNLMFLLQKWKKKLNLKYSKLLESLNKNYLKLQKYQKEKLECILSGKELSVSKNKNFKKIQVYFS